VKMQNPNLRFVNNVNYKHWVCENIKESAFVETSYLLTTFSVMIVVQEKMFVWFRKLVNICKDGGKCKKT